jgi:hydrogenase/urease accessory protein HupE
MSFDAFARGFLNPLTIPAHLLALLGLGLLIGTQPRGSLWSAFSFVAGLAVGLTAIAQAVGLTPALDLLLLASAVIGALVAMGLVLPQVLLAAIALICGLALGLDSPPQAISLADATAALFGTGLAASLAIAIVIAGSGRLRLLWQRIGLRILGSWIAASAILVLALRFSRGMLFGM